MGIRATMKATAMCMVWAAASGICFQAVADALTWVNSTSGTQQWSSSANWVNSGGSTAVPADGDTLTVPIASGQKVDFDGSGYAGGTNSITFTSLTGAGVGNSTLDITAGTLTDSRVNWSPNNLKLLVSGGTFEVTRFVVGTGNDVELTGGQLTALSNPPFQVTGGVFTMGAGSTLAVNGERFYMSGGALNANGGTINKGDGGGYSVIGRNGQLNIGGDVVMNGAATYFVIGSNRLDGTTAGTTPTMNLNSGSFTFNGTRELMMGWSYSSDTTIIEYTSKLNLNGGTWSPDAVADPNNADNLRVNVDYNRGGGNYRTGMRGEVTQDGATSYFRSLVVGESSRTDQNTGHYDGVRRGALLNMFSGDITVADLHLGNATSGTGANSDLTMTGGTLNITNALILYPSFSQSLYESTGATWDNAYRNDISITGGTVTFNSTFDIRSADETANVDLSGGQFVFQSADGILEAPGRDIGPSATGLLDNYALGTLEVAAGAILTLQDSFDNLTADGGAAEAVYVTDLILGDGSTIDLAGFNLYYLGLTQGAGVTVSGGALTHIPEPTAGMLFALGLAFVLRRRHGGR